MKFPGSLDKRTLTTVVLAFLLGGLLTLTGFSLTSANPNGGVVLTVNGEALKKDDFYTRLEQEAGKDVLDQMVTEMVVAQAESKYGFTISQDEIDAEIAKIRDKYPSDEAFAEALSRFNMSKERLQHEIRLNLILNKASRQGVSVTDEEIAKYFEENKDSLGTPEQVKVRHILVKSEDEAKDLVKQIRDGADFAELAKAHSIDTASAAQGGSVGTIQQDSPIVEPFKEAAFKLQVGEVSDPVKSEFGWHILRVDEHKDAAPATLDASKEQIRQTLIKQKSRPVGDIISELRQEANVQVKWPQYESLATSPKSSERDAAASDSKDQKQPASDQKAPTGGKKSSGEESSK